MRTTSVKRALFFGTSCSPSNARLYRETDEDLHGYNLQTGCPAGQQSRRDGGNRFLNRDSLDEQSVGDVLRSHKVKHDMDVDGRELGASRDLEEQRPSAPSERNCEPDSGSSASAKEQGVTCSIAWPNLRTYLLIHAVLFFLRRVFFDVRVNHRLFKRERGEASDDR